MGTPIRRLEEGVNETSRLGCADEGMLRFDVCLCPTGAEANEEEERLARLKSFCDLILSKEALLNR